MRTWKHLDFTLEEIAEMILHGFRSAFLPYEEKQALLAEVESQVQALAAA